MQMVKKLAVVCLVASCLSVLALFVYDMTIQKNANDYLENMISEFTFVFEENDEELNRLRTLKERVPEMSHRTAAIYYRTLTKLYMLRADSDRAFLTFIDAQIHAELAKAYDVIAWLYADISQIYIDFDTYDLAKECITTALAYGKEQPMQDFFYEYCYVQLAEIETKLGNIENALTYEETSRKWDRDGIDLPEYQSMDLRRQLILVSIAMKNGDYDTCKLGLDVLTDEFNTLSYPPTDILWISGIYYPYLEYQTKLAILEEEYEVVLNNMEVLFTAGTLYGKMDSLINFLGEVMELIPDIENSSISTNIQREIEACIQKIILDYHEVFQHKNKTAGTHIYNSNMATIAVFVQRNKMANIYKRIAIGVCLIILVFTVLILFWRKSTLKGRIDGLTGAYIRKHYDKVYGDLVKSKIPFGLIMYDIDFFKQVNDGFGHEAGDIVLRTIAKTAMGYLDKNCKLYRYGGDEFCIICRHKSLEELAQLAERIRYAVEQIKWKQDFKPTLSIGVAHSERTNQDVKLTVDEKLYESKEAGRNHVSW